MFESPQSKRKGRTKKERKKEGKKERKKLLIGASPEGASL
jgi:hypothetical protein